ncbi:MAG: amidohydrolase [Desulfobacterales bacterium]
MLDILIHNAAVLTVNPAFDILRPGMVGIRNGIIETVHPESPEARRPRARSTVDAGGGILMPGLVNAHTHLPMVLFRGLADDLPLDDWLNLHIFPAEARHIRPAAVGAATRLACAELLLSGTTTCCDAYFHEDTVAECLSEMGMRAVAAQGVIDFPAPGVPDPASNIEVARDFVEKWTTRDTLVTPSIFCHSPYTCGEATLKRAKAAADDLGVILQIHVAETRQEVERSLAEHGLTPVRRLDRMGVLDERTLLVHCVWLADDDIEILAERGSPVVHCPESNMKLASGVAPVPRLLAAGATVGLGTDGAASNNDLDLFREMDAAAKLHKMATGDPTAMDARTVLRMATSNAAAAIGLGEIAGSIEPGKAADLVFLDPGHPALMPDYHPESLAVYAAGGGTVRDVMVGGRFRVRNRRLTGGDMDRIMEEVRSAAREIGGPAAG